MVSRSIVETLHRSLTISLINMLVMFAMLVLGGASIRKFVAVLLIGLASRHILLDLYSCADGRGLGTG